MFVELSKMLEQKGSAVTINVTSLGDGRLSVMVLPKGEWKENTLGQGMTLKATPEELDADFVSGLERFVPAHKSLQEQVESTMAVLEAATKESKSKAATAIKKVAGSQSEAGNKVVAATPSPVPSPAKSASVPKAEPDTIDLF